VRTACATRKAEQPRVVLWTACCALVLDERLATEVSDRHGAKAAGCAVFPRFLEGDAVDYREQVDSVWRDAQLNDLAGLAEIAGRESDVADPKSASADIKRSALTGVGSTNTSRSFVNRGRP